MSGVKGEKTLKHKTRTKVWSILLSLALLLGLMPGMSLTALATSPAGAYSAYDVTTDANKTKTGDDLAALQVTFNGMPWYIIEDNSTAADAGTVTLFAKECVGVSVFSTNGDKFYSRSTVKAYLDGLTAEGGSFAGVADAIVGTDLTDMSVTGAKLYLLSTDEANAVPADARKCSKPSEAVRNYWWLRSYSSFSSSAVFVDGGDGAVHTDGSDVGSAFGVRPALQLDLSKVTSDATSKTFTVAGGHTHDFTYSADGATITAICSADDCTLPEVDGKPAYPELCAMYATRTARPAFVLSCRMTK